MGMGNTKVTEMKQNMGTSMEMDRGMDMELNRNMDTVDRNTGTGAWNWNMELDRIDILLEQNTDMLLLKGDRCC